MENSILPAAWQVPEVFRKRLGSKVGRQRLMVSDGHLLLVLHAPPKHEENERVGRFFWRAPDGAWSSNAFGGGPHALIKHLDEYASVIDRLDQLEDRAGTAAEYYEVLELLAPISRAARNQHSVLQEARKNSADLREIIDLRDRAYQIERTAELLYTEAKNSLDFAVAKGAEEQARSSQHIAEAAHRLNLLAAFFFPIATLTAIFGVNLRHGLEEAQPPLGFLALICVGLLLGAIVMAFVSRPARP